MKKALNVLLKAIALISAAGVGYCVAKLTDFDDMEEDEYSDADFEDADMSVYDMQAMQEMTKTPNEENDDNSSAAKISIETSPTTSVTNSDATVETSCAEPTESTAEVGHKTDASERRKAEEEIMPEATGDTTIITKPSGELKSQQLRPHETKPNNTYKHYQRPSQYNHGKGHKG